MGWQPNMTSCKRAGSQYKRAGLTFRFATFWLFGWRTRMTNFIHKRSLLVRESLHPGQAKRRLVPFVMSMLYIYIRYTYTCIQYLLCKFLVNVSDALCVLQKGRLKINTPHTFVLWKWGWREFCNRLATANRSERNLGITERAQSTCPRMAHC